MESTERVAAGMQLLQRGLFFEDRTTAMATRKPASAKRRDGTSDWGRISYCTQVQNTLKCHVSYRPSQQSLPADRDKRENGYTQEVDDARDTTPFPVRNITRATAKKLRTIIPAENVTPSARQRAQPSASHNSRAKTTDYR